MGASEHLGKRFGGFGGRGLFGGRKGVKDREGERFVSWERSFSG